jgi:hypothetical protein
VLEGVPTNTVPVFTDVRGGCPLAQNFKVRHCPNIDCEARQVLADHSSGWGSNQEGAGESVFNVQRGQRAMRTDPSASSSTPSEPARRGTTSKSDAKPGDVGSGSPKSQTFH